MLHHKFLDQQTASTEALKKTAATTFFTTGIVEAMPVKYEIYGLKQRKQNGELTERNYNREVTKTITGTVCITALLFQGE